MKRLIACITAILCSGVMASEKNSVKAVTLEKAEIPFANQWGLDAINIPNAVAAHSAESLGLLPPNVNNGSQIIYSNRSGQWFGESQQSGYWLGKVSSTSSTLNAQSTNDIAGVNAAFVNGRFSAETGVIGRADQRFDDESFYLHGAVSLVSNDNFSLSLTAKFETLGENAISHYYGLQNMALQQSLYKEQAINTTLGLVTTYAINKHWKVMGMVSATNLDSKIEQSPLIPDNSVQMAVIGTSYSF